MNCADHVLLVNPTHPLLPVADLAAHAESERCQHLPQRASLFAEHDAGAHLDGADARIGSSPGCRVPLAANAGKEAAAGCTVLVQQFLASIAVVPDCGTTGENLRLV